MEATATTTIDLMDAEDNHHVDEIFHHVDHHHAVETVNVPQISDERREWINTEMFKLEDEISTLRQTLSRKERQLQELRNELGITRWSRLKESDAVNKSKEAISNATVKTGQYLRDFGTATASKWCEIKQSENVRTMSEKFWSTTGVVKNEFGCRLGWQGNDGQHPPSNYGNVAESAFNSLGGLMCANVNTISDESDDEERVVIE